MECSHNVRIVKEMEISRYSVSILGVSGIRHDDTQLGRDCVLLRTDGQYQEGKVSSWIERLRKAYWVGDQSILLSVCEDNNSPVLCTDRTGLGGGQRPFSMRYCKSR